MVNKKNLLNTSKITREIPVKIYLLCDLKKILYFNARFKKLFYKFLRKPFLFKSNNIEFTCFKAKMFSQALI